MTVNQINHKNAGMNTSLILLAVFVVTLFLVTALQAVDLPPELPLWEKPPEGYPILERCQRASPILQGATWLFEYCNVFIKEIGSTE